MQAGSGGLHNYVEHDETFSDMNVFTMTWLQLYVTWLCSIWHDFMCDTIQYRGGGVIHVHMISRMIILCATWCSLEGRVWSMCVCDITHDYFMRDMMQSRRGGLIHVHVWCDALSYMWHDCVHCITWRSTIMAGVAWPIDTSDTTHCYMWHICDVTWGDVSLRDMTQYGGNGVTRLQMWHDAFAHVTWRILMCDVTWRDYVRHNAIWRECRDSFTHVTWLLYTNDMTHSHVWRNMTWLCATWCSMVGVVWHIYTCDMTHLRMWYDAFVCVTWRDMTMCDMTQYGGSGVEVVKDKYQQSVEYWNKHAVISWDNKSRSPI